MKSVKIEVSADDLRVLCVKAQDGNDQLHSSTDTSAALVGQYDITRRRFRLLKQRRFINRELQLIAALQKTL